MHIQCTYNARSFPACLPACVPVSTNFKYDYYTAGLQKRLGSVIWKDFLSAVKVCNIRFELLVVKPISICRSLRQHLRQGVANQSQA
jgi:hypothetical protein